MNIERFDPETVETVAGVVRLLHQAAVLAWSAADAEGPGSVRQLFALNVDEAVDHARALLPSTANLAGPVPIGGNPATLLRSADELLGLLIGAAPATLGQLQTRVADLVWEANTGVGAWPPHDRRASRRMRSSGAGVAVRPGPGRGASDGASLARFGPCRSQSVQRPAARGGRLAQR
jgi:hypothetical protein